MDFTDKRLAYEKDELKETSLPSNPFDLFELWIKEALDCDVPEPYAMSLATCGSDMMPTVRTVLLREITDNSIVFYTNYLSDKGVDIAQNPKAESLFFWHDMQRQIRVRGNISKLTSQQSDDYFQKRPYESQIGAWASQPQSGVVESRVALEDIYAALKYKFPDKSAVPRPDFWGGYEIRINQFEFWQGRPSRLHDRLVYTKDNKTIGQVSLIEPHLTDWKIIRLKP